MSQKESSTTIEETFAIPPTFVDVLSLAIAQSDNREFSADWEKWHRTIASFIQEKASDCDLFDDIHFQGGAPYTPFSDQVDSFLSIMRRSGCFELVGQGQNSNYVIDQGTKDSIITQRNQRLCVQENILAELTERINKDIGIK